MIATAKAMFLEGYGDSFPNIAEIIETATPEQLACSKRDYEYQSSGRTKYSGFALQGACKRDPALMDCYFELEGDRR